MWSPRTHLADQLVPVVPPHVSVGGDGEGVSGEGVEGEGGRVHHKAAASTASEQTGDTVWWTERRRRQTHAVTESAHKYMSHRQYICHKQYICLSLIPVGFDGYWYIQSEMITFPGFTVRV